MAQRVMTLGNVVGRFTMQQLLAQSCRPTSFLRLGQPAARALHACAVVGQDAQESLLDAIRTEIEDERSNGAPPRLEAQWGRFSITQTPGTSFVSFAHDEGHEQVEVSVDLNSCDFDPELVSADGVPAAPPIGGGDGSTEPLPHATDVTIDIENRSGLILHVEAELAQGELLLSRMGLRRKTDNHEETYMTNVDQLDEKLYTALQDYLTEKGVDSEFAEMASNYISDKEFAEYLNWLNGMQTFCDC